MKWDKIAYIALVAGAIILVIVVAIIAPKH
jgi:hypothetical protein